MGIFNQGWNIVCDECCEVLTNELGGYGKREIRKIAHEAGFINRHDDDGEEIWFCGSMCFSDYFSKKAKGE